MRIRRSPLSVAVFAVLVLILTTSSAHAGPRNTRARAKVFSFVNRYRHQHGMRGVRQVRTVDRIAWRHSDAMGSHRTLFHTSNMWTKLRSFHPRRWGENVGMGPSAWSVFKAWTRSSTHRANMLNRRFRRAGVGVVRRHGYYWITMIYLG